MFTRCPSCRAAFSITNQQLEIAAGMVRCGMCEHVFDARLYLFNQSNEDSADIDVQLEQEESTNIDLEFLDKQLHGTEEQELTPDQVLEEEEEEGPENSSSSEDSSDDSLEDSNDKPETHDLNAPIPPKIIADQVSNLENESSHFPLGKLLAFIVVCILISAMTLQIISVTKLSLIPTEYQAKICPWITCVTPIPRALNKIEVLNRSIYTHQTEKNALMVTVTIVNRAQFSQSYPITQLRFLNVAGDVIAARQFGPNHYLNTTWQPENLMEPNIPVSIKMEVEDVGEEVVSYDFEFL